MVSPPIILYIVGDSFVILTTSTIEPKYGATSLVTFAFIVFCFFVCVADNRSTSGSAPDVVRAFYTTNRTDADKLAATSANLERAFR